MQTLLIGTYTRNTSEGIYRIELNTDTNKLENLSLVAKAQNPTYLEYNKDTQELYSVYQDGDMGGLAVYDYKNQIANLKNVMEKEGVQPCYVHYNSVRNELYDANYHRGEVNIYEDTKLKDTFVYEKGGHAHFAHTHPTTNALYTVDLGNDLIHKYVDGKEVSTFSTPKGSGPRHLVFHPNTNIIYVFTELSNEVFVLKDSDIFEQVQVISTLPEGATPGGGAAIRISQDAKSLYVTNRGHDSITLFNINEDTTLSFAQNLSSYGGHPRDFNLSLDDKYIVLANRDDNNLVLYTRDTDTGRLTYVSSDTQVPEPVCVLFINE